MRGFRTLCMPLALVAAMLAPLALATSHGHQHPLSADDMDMQGMNMMDMDMTQMKALPTSPQDMPSTSMHGGHSMAGHQMGGHQMGGHQMGGHAHDFWVEAPTSYKDKTFAEWNSYEQASSGMVIYRDQCAMCHGIDGRGTGPLAKSLKHTPADLTNHFHQGPGKGDQYLFWRVSEGGVVEPFASMDSAMPAFKHRLSESEIWSVLAYVHQAFHQGFNTTAANSHGMQSGHGKGHH